MSKKVTYGKIVIDVKATERDINENELVLSDRFEVILERLQEWLKGQYAGVFAFSVEEEDEIPT